MNPARSRHCNGEFLPHPLRKLGKEAVNEEPEPGDLIAHMLYSRWMGGGNFVISALHIMEGFYI